MSIAEHLKQLRQRMTEHRLDYLYVPSTDAHRNEYVPDCWNRRAWISGFTGSAGDVLIGKQAAYLWTDGRYFLQAEQQLDPRYFQLMKLQPHSPSIEKWLTEQEPKLRIGVDPQLMTVSQYTAWNKQLASNQSKLVPLSENWIDALWDTQPAVPQAPIYPLEIRYTGYTAKEKIEHLRLTLRQCGADATVLTQLDSIAWLFNFRGNDIQYNPLAICYAILSLKQATLFIDFAKLSLETRDYFSSQGISVKEYGAFQEDLSLLRSHCLLLDPNATSWWTHTALKEAEIKQMPCPVTLAKSIKNATEQKGMALAHRLDAIAMVKFFSWIEQHWPKGITEREAAHQLAQFRYEDPRCKDLSFSTISGFGAHGAIIHYSAQESTDALINDSALYLIDSGGQYCEGTTDVTRTLHLGTPSSREKRHYTLVLKSHLNLRHTCFPIGTTGLQLDAIARQPLWQVGYDYPHGTGHGVGCFLCVHEGPQSLSPRGDSIPLQAGMIVSNEPGLYFEGHYGIRIENVCLIQPHPHNPSFLQLTDLTLVPYARQLIDTELLCQKEVDWIDEYHEMIYQLLSPDLPKPLQRWLREATAPLTAERDQHRI